MLQYFTMVKLYSTVLDLSWICEIDPLFSELAKEK